MRHLMTTNSWLPSVFNDFFDMDFAPRSNSYFTPSINVKENDKEYIVEFAAPGIKKENFNIRINDEGNIVIRMENKQEKQEENTRYLRKDFSFSKYEQTFVLPDEVNKENISAQMENGILSVKLPKMVEEKAKLSRQILIG